jgi:hypothetical protein
MLQDIYRGLRSAVEELWYDKDLVEDFVASIAFLTNAGSHVSVSIGNVIIRMDKVFSQEDIWKVTLISDPSCGNRTTGIIKRELKLNGVKVTEIMGGRDGINVHNKPSLEVFTSQVEKISTHTEAVRLTHLRDVTRMGR